MSRSQWLILFFCWSFSVAAQVPPSTFVVIDSIVLEGNEKTREGIIFRELDFKIGDTLRLEELAQRLPQNERQILNTGLFTQAQFNIRRWDQQTHRLQLHLEVREHWYIYPIPIFELADRNFNVWWVDQNRSFSRVNYGIRFYHINTSGRGDQIKVLLQNGYSQKFQLRYHLPFINRKKTLGIRADLLYSRAREANYRTANNRQQFEAAEADAGYHLQRYRAAVELTLRQHLFVYHRFQTGYYHRLSQPLITDELNPRFFGQSRPEQRFISLQYQIEVDRRDIKAYPQSGYFLQGTLRKEGVGLFDDLNTLRLRATFAQYAPLGDRWSAGLILSGQAHLIRGDLPYYNSRALGYGSHFLRGYEYYVIEGLDYAYARSSLRVRILQRNWNLKQAMPIKALRIMPIQIFLTGNVDAGYVNHPYADASNTFTNRFLIGGGPGLDIVTYVDKMLRLEYSWNHLGENALFLHFQLSF